jgi:hypothetical protein
MVNKDAAVALEVLAPPSPLPALLYRVLTEQPGGYEGGIGPGSWGALRNGLLGTGDGRSMGAGMGRVSG